MIVPREDVPAGYMDPALDDYTSDDDPFKYWQTAIIKASHRVAVGVQPHLLQNYLIADHLCRRAVRCR